MASNRRALTGQRLTFITTKPESVRALPASKRTGAFLYQRIIEDMRPITALRSTSSRRPL
jgi:hypothetical protein